MFYNFVVKITGMMTNFQNSRVPPRTSDGLLETGAGTWMSEESMAHDSVTWPVSLCTAGAGFNGKSVLALGP